MKKSNKIRNSPASTSFLRTLIGADVSGAAVPFSMAGNSNDSSYEVGVEVSQQHGSGILDCHLDNDRTFLCMQQSSKILYHIYEE